MVVGMVLLVGVAVSMFRAGSNGAADQRSSNAEARHALEQEGFDLSATLTYTHFLYFADQSDADAAAQALSPEFAVEVTPPRGGSDRWALTAVHTAALDAAEMNAVTDRLTDLAHRFDGEYDGWGFEPTGALPLLSPTGPRLHAR